MTHTIEQLRELAERATPGPWEAFSNGASSSTLSQSTALKIEGTGSLRDAVTIGSQGSGTWAGASRDDPGRCRPP